MGWADEMQPNISPLTITIYSIAYFSPASELPDTVFTLELAASTNELGFL